MPGNKKERTLVYLHRPVSEFRLVRRPPRFLVVEQQCRGQATWASASHNIYVMYACVCGWCSCAHEEVGAPWGWLRHPRGLLNASLCRNALVSLDSRRGSLPPPAHGTGGVQNAFEISALSRPSHGGPHDTT